LPEENPALQIIRANSCRVTPWKNGGGSTTEIAAEPLGASLDTFDWRISMARVASDGPFSEFPGIDRTLAVVTGHGLALTIGDAAPMMCGCESEPVTFAGDIATSAKLTLGAITDLNVMTRRQRYIHQMRRIRQPTSCKCDEADIAVILSFNGSTTVALHHDIVTLDHGDAAILALAREPEVQFVPFTASDCYLVLLRELSPR
jgi:environmental stress-induced protein Ves